MEILLDKKEFQKISTEFRRVSSRLLRTRHEDGINNLKRFLSYIENTPLIWEFIQQNNIVTFDIENEVNNRDFGEGYNIPLDKSEEIAYVYQLLKYCAENCSDYWSICSYYSPGKTYQDHVDAFNDRVVHPFISHIEVYLRERWIEMGEEGKIQINVHGGQVAIAQDHGTVNATQHNHYGQIANLQVLVEQFKELIDSLNIGEEEKQDTKEILDIAVLEVKSDKPRRSLLKHAIEKIEYMGKLGTGLNGLSTVSQKLIDLFNQYLL
jgi:hypothetical protein